MYLREAKTELQKPHLASNRKAIATRSAQLKFAPIALDRTATFDEAIAVILGNTFDHIVANIPAAYQGQDIEGVHQVRVGLRKLRSALALFKAYIPEPQLAWMKDEAKWLLSALAQVRDLDVFAVDFLPRLAKAKSNLRGTVALKAALEVARNIAQQQARGALDSARTQRFVRRYETWLAGQGWKSASGDDTNGSRTRPLDEFAARAINKRMVKILARGKRISSLPVADLHQLRIAVKKTRYILEFLHCLLPRERYTKLTRALKELQDSLGHLNDLDMSEKIVAFITSAADRTTSADKLATAGQTIVCHQQEAATLALGKIDKPWRRLRTCGLI